MRIKHQKTVRHYHLFALFPPRSYLLLYLLPDYQHGNNWNLKWKMMILMNTLMYNMHTNKTILNKQPISIKQVFEK